MRLKPFILCIAVLLALSFALPTSLAASRNVDIPILLYHHLRDDYPKDEALMNISPGEFKMHMTTLKNAGYTTIDFHQYHDFITGSASLPEKPIIISFDDGYESNYTYAYPILKELEMKATIFVVTDSVGRTKGLNFPHFSWAEGREMERSGFIDIQSHSDTHDNYKFMNVQTIQRELRRSKYLIEKFLNKECTVFAYPYGLHSEDTRRMAKEAGYTMQCLVGDEGINDKNTPLHSIRRVTISGGTSSKELLAKIELKILAFQASKVASPENSAL